MNRQQGREGSTSSLSRFFMHERALLEGPFDDASDTPILGNRPQRKTTGQKMERKRVSAVPRKRRQRVLQDDEEPCQEDREEDGADTVIKPDYKTERKKRKKRRAPVNDMETSANTTYVLEVFRLVGSLTLKAPSILESRYLA